MRISPSPIVPPIGAKFAFPSSLRVVTIVSVIMALSIPLRPGPCFSHQRTRSIHPRSRRNRDPWVASSVDPVKHPVSHVAEAKVGDERAMSSAGDPVGQHGRTDGRLEPFVFLGRHVDLKAPPKAVRDLLFPPPGPPDGLTSGESGEPPEVLPPP